MEQNKDYGHCYTTEELATEFNVSIGRMRNVIREKSIESIILKHKKYITGKGRNQLKIYYNSIATKDRKDRDIRSIVTDKAKNKILQSSTLKELKTLFSDKELKDLIYHVLDYNPKQNWHDKPSVKKGDYGEAIVHKYFKNKGYTVYAPLTEGKHMIDGFVVSNNDNTTYCFEVKTHKFRREYQDTGITLTNFIRYKDFEKKTGYDLFIFFIDESNSHVYGNYLTDLSTKKTIYHCNARVEYPLHIKEFGKAMVYFPLCNMVTAGKLDIDDKEELKTLTLAMKE